MIRTFEFIAVVTHLAYNVPRTALHVNDPADLCWTGRAGYCLYIGHTGNGSGVNCSRRRHCSKNNSNISRCSSSILSASRRRFFVARCRITAAVAFISTARDAEASNTALHHCDHE